MSVWCLGNSWPGVSGGSPIWCMDLGALGFLTVPMSKTPRHMEHNLHPCKNMVTKGDPFPFFEGVANFSKFFQVLFCLLFSFTGSTGFDTWVVFHPKVIIILKLSNPFCKVIPYCKPLAIGSMYGAFTGMSMVLSKWITTPIQVGCKSPN